MTIRKLSKLFTTNGMALAVMAATAMAARADVFIDNPDYVTPNDPANWNSNVDVKIGYQAGQNVNVILDNTGDITTVNTRYTYIGDAYGSTASLTVTGDGAAWISNDNGYLSVGFSGAGELTIANGGQVSSGSGHIGFYPGSRGTVTVDGVGSTWTNSGYLSVYYGELTITNGGQVNSTSGIVGKSNTVTVDGVGSTWTNSDYLDFYEDGKLIITNGGQVRSMYGYIGGKNTGTVTVDGVGSTWTNTDHLSVGNGELTITNGGQVDSASGDIGDSSKVTVDGMGSTWINRGRLDVGDYWGGGELIITNGGRVDVAGDYIQNSYSSLTMDIGSDGSGILTVGGNINLDGILILTLNGSLDTDFYVLIENFDGNSINGFFSDILFDNQWVTLTQMDDMHGGTFMVDDMTYYLSYTGDATTGSLYGGNSLVLSTIAGGPSPAVPEPASLAILGLGAAALIARRRK